MSKKTAIYIDIKKNFHSKSYDISETLQEKHIKQKVNSAVTNQTFLNRNENVGNEPFISA